LLLSNPWIAARIEGRYLEPAPELNFQNFVESLLAKAIAVAKSKK